MLPKWHILAGAIFALLLFYFFNISYLEASLVFFSSFLIDIDHYLYYLWKEKNLSLKKAYYWHINLGKFHKTVLHIFHTFEFIMLLIFLSFLWNIFSFVCIGVLFHSVMDLLDTLSRGRRAFNNREFFLTKYFLKIDKKKYL